MNITVADLNWNLTPLANEILIIFYRYMYRHMSDKNREQDERANNKCIDYRAVDCYLKLTYHNLQIIG